MKKFLTIVVVLGLVALYWFGCQRKAVEEPVEFEPVMEQPEEMIPPPPPEVEVEEVEVETIE